MATNEIQSLARYIAEEQAKIAQRIFEETSKTTLGFVVLFFGLLAFMWIICFLLRPLWPRPWNLLYALPRGEESSSCRLHAKIAFGVFLFLGGLIAFYGMGDASIIERLLATFPSVSINEGLVSRAYLLVLVLVSIAWFSFPVLVANVVLRGFRTFYSLTEPLVFAPRLTSLVDGLRSLRMHKAALWHYLRDIVDVVVPGYGGLAKDTRIDAQSVCGVHLMAALNVGIPKVSVYPFMFFYSQQRVWCDRFSDSPLNLATAQGNEYVFFNVTSCAASKEMDKALGCSLLFCLRTLVQNHTHLDRSFSPPKQVRLPRAVRLIFGHEMNLVTLVRSVPQAAWEERFPSIADPTGVLNLWLSRRILSWFDVLGWCNNRTTTASLTAFRKAEFDWWKLCRAYMTSQGLYANPTDEFVPWASSRLVGSPRIRDFLAIGVEHFQIGYKRVQRLPDAERVPLCHAQLLDALPFLLMATHFKQALSFGDVLRYVHHRQVQIRAESWRERRTFAKGLAKELRQFQLNVG